MATFKKFTKIVNEAKVVKVKIKDLNFDEHNINGRLRLKDVFTSDASVIIESQERLDDWIKAFTKSFGNSGYVEIDPNQPSYNQFKIVGNKKFSDYIDKYINAKAASLSRWGTTE